MSSPRETDGAAGCLDPTRNHADEGGFTGPVRADQGAGLAHWQVEVDVRIGGDPGIGFGKAARRKQAHGSHRIQRARMVPTMPCEANNVSATSATPTSKR